MKKIIGFILVAVVAAGGCTSETKNEESISTATTPSTEVSGWATPTGPTTTTTSAAAPMTEPSASCNEGQSVLISMWGHINTSVESASDAGVTSVIRAQLSATGRDAIKATRTWITVCGRSYPPATIAVYEGWMTKLKLIIGE